MIEYLSIILGKTKRIIVLTFLIFLSNISTFSQTSPRIALVLSGGGVLGYAHIGVLQALDEEGIKPSIIAGTSMGAIVGALYSQGYSGKQLFEFIKQRKLNNIYRNVHVSFLNINRGLGSYKHVHDLLNDAIPHNSFDSLSIPFICVSTNIQTGKPEVRYSGNNLAEWVLASASIPVVFKPQLIDGEYYCDGGFVDNLPANYLPEDSYDICIGIDLVPSKKPNTDNYFSEEYSASDVYCNMILDINSVKGREKCDYIIQPHKDVKYGLLDFRKYKILYQKGYNEMKQWIESHSEILERK
ncbi:MAG: patatin-like phospholipase family protein [Bacteroidales bacterium]|nr:patatin-like phospholipase family protein [Bacteroidales bacterium]